MTDGLHVLCVLHIEYNLEIWKLTARGIAKYDMNSLHDIQNRSEIFRIRHLTPATQEHPKV